MLNEVSQESLVIQEHQIGEYCDVKLLPPLMSKAQTQQAQNFPKI
jgi:hypothetical protein